MNALLDDIYRIRAAAKARDTSLFTPVASNLLHNMSAPSKTVLKRQAGGRIGRGVVYALPSVQLTTAGDLLQALGKAAPANDRAAQTQLLALIQTHAAQVGLPAAAVIHDKACPGDEVCSDLLTILAVQSKSSGSVYLRDKEPNLTAIVPGRRVVVVPSPEWRAKP